MAAFSKLLVKPTSATKEGLKIRDDPRVGRRERAWRLTVPQKIKLQCERKYIPNERPFTNRTRKRWKDPQGERWEASVTADTEEGEPLKLI